MKPLSCQLGVLNACRQDEEGNYKLPQDEVAAIKHELIGLMISVPPSIQSQLGEAIGVIADSDFWERWDTLVDVSFPLGRLLPLVKTDVRAGPRCPPHA